MRGMMQAPSLPHSVKLYTCDDSNTFDFNTKNDKLAILILF